MNFKFQFGSKVFFGKNCLTENRDELLKLGKRAFLVTGKNSGRTSGALDDVINVLEEQQIQYKIFDETENNPTVENVSAGADLAKSFKSDFVIGLGGGSPLDAAKAVAVLAVNDISSVDLFKNVFTKKPLPIVSIPTTAGTGSEVTQYSIMTRHDLETKMSFGNEFTFPQLAFLDAGYTMSMSKELTYNTALDALSHAVEGYTTKRSMPLSDFYAEEVFRLFGQSIGRLVDYDMDFEFREKLLYTSMLAGMVIAQAGTTIVHGMGYSLTYFKGIPHGKANAVFMKEYLSFNYDAIKDKIDNIIKLMGLSGVDEFGDVIGKLILTDERLKSITNEEISKYTRITMGLRSIANNVKTVTQDDIYGMMHRSIMM